MSNYEVTERKLVITDLGKKSGEWVWLHLGGWSKGLKNPSVERFASSEEIERKNLIASDDELNDAVNKGFFEYRVVTTVVSWV